MEHLFTDCQLYWNDENKEKEAGNGPFLKTNSLPIFALPRWQLSRHDARPEAEEEWAAEEAEVRKRGQHSSFGGKIQTHQSQR